ncbi:hypothetical protein [Ectobacillus panaciterrae]|uniref:hypothetical protein n=1 Tax=Ectobacillus panaciterrae TaxID=363872 RepID=UPI00040309B4|nr:hypothetical protein [Ectobacillus panaciterrae]
MSKQMIVNILIFLWFFAVFLLMHLYFPDAEAGRYIITAVPLLAVGFFLISLATDLITAFVKKK